MALPRLNSAPKYSMTIPSTKQKVRFRPFLVKEEKVLLLAMESDETVDIFNAIIDTLEVCIQDEIDKNILTTFDVEYMFLQLRAKSVGETSNIGVACKKCETTNEISVNLDEIKVTVPDVPNKLELDGEYILEVKWPSYADAIYVERYKKPAEQTFALLRSCMVSLFASEERTLFADEAEDDIDDFIDSLNKEQFDKIREFIEKIPAVKHDLDFACVKCKQNNELTLEGLKDFFPSALPTNPS